MNNGYHHLDTLHSENPLEPNSISQGVRLQVKDVHGTLDFELNLKLFASFLFYIKKNINENIKNFDKSK